MPIFEYICKKCDCQFEQLFLTPNDPLPQCPKCGGKKLRKLVSAGSIRPQGVPTGSGGYKPPACMSSDK